MSREDDDKTFESESITNQKRLLLQYAKENNLSIYDIYIDDGYFGTNFDRPEFRRLINDIELKKINMVITKDMSRLGRDYIGTGELVEKFFPEHNVRYIAVTDNIYTYLDNTNNDIAPFKAIMNDFYAKDISKKIKSSLKAKMKEGKYVGGRVPFGYTKDKNNKNQLIINEDQFNRVKNRLELELDRKITRLNELKNSSLNKTTEDKINKKIENFINKFLSMDNPTRELISSLIDRIDIYEDKRVIVSVAFCQ